MKPEELLKKVEEGMVWFGEWVLHSDDLANRAHWWDILNIRGALDCQEYVARSLDAINMPVQTGSVFNVMRVYGDIMQRNPSKSSLYRYFMDGFNLTL